MRPFLYQLMVALGVRHPVPARPFGGDFGEAPARSDAAGLLASLLTRSGPTCPIFTEEQKAAVWHKGQPIIGWDPNEWRVDHHGRPLFRPAYGDSTSDFGWEIGHILAREQGGSDHVSNLRPQRCEDERPYGTRLSDALDKKGRGR